MRLPPITAVRTEAVPTQSEKVHQARGEGSSGKKEPRKSGIQPQGCCGVNVCIPFVGCHCLGIQSPFC